jgi:hypothetical protein
MGRLFKPLQQPPRHTPRRRCGGTVPVAGYYQVVSHKGADDHRESTVKGMATTLHGRARKQQVVRRVTAMARHQGKMGGCGCISRWL